MWNEKYLRDKKGGFYRTYSDLTILSSWEERKITSSHFTSFDLMTLTKHNFGIYQHTWNFIHQTRGLNQSLDGLRRVEDSW